MRYAGVYVIVLTCLLMMNCSGGPKPTGRESWGKSMNAERERRGIPVLQDGWVCDLAELPRRVTCWHPQLSEGSLKRPSHVTKFIVLNDGDVVEESDIYESDKTYVFSEMDPTVFNVAAVIRYSYRDAAAGRWPWKCHVRYQRDYVLDCTLERAEEILRSWGLSRLVSPAPAMSSGATSRPTS